jgi:hypothetical protein
VYKEDLAMYKIVCVMAAHGREEITIKTIQRLKKQKYPLYDIVLVGDSDLEEGVADMLDCTYVEHPNMPLSDKWQAGVKKARELEPDAIMICGSDSWHTRNWTKCAVKQLEKGFDLMGTTFFYTCRAYPGRLLKIVQRRYVGKRALEPVGSGRVISSRILNKINWKLFPEGKRSGLDKPSYDMIVNNKGRVALIYQDIKVIGIKSTWDTLNPWKDTFKSSQTVRFIKEIAKPKYFLSANFDRAVHDLIEVVPNLIIGE